MGRSLDHTPQLRFSFCNVGVIGHLGHGKTALTTAITKIMADHRHGVFVPYEQIANVSDAIAHVSYQSLNRNVLYNHMDFPSRADNPQNVISGVTQMDGAILVVSAAEGPMPGTREHVMLASHFGKRPLVVFLNKVDLVDSKRIAQIEAEVRELLSAHGFPGNTIPIIQGSALAALEGKTPEIGAQAVTDLINAIDYNIPLPERDADKSFRMMIEKALFEPGRGMVASGRIQAGITKVGEQLEIFGLRENSELPIRDVVSSFYLYGDDTRKNYDQAKSGDYVSLVFRNVDKNDLKAGQVLSKPGLFARAYFGFTADVHFLSIDEGGLDSPLWKEDEANFHLGTADIAGLFMSFGERVPRAEPGGNYKIRVQLFDSVFIEMGQSIAIHQGGRIIGLGAIAEIIPSISRAKRAISVPELPEEPTDEDITQ